MASTAGQCIIAQIASSVPTNTPQQMGEVEIAWREHPGKSCQSYANGDTTERSLEESKLACVKNDECAARHTPPI